MNHSTVPRSLEQCHDEVVIGGGGRWRLHGWSRAGCQTGFALLGAGVHIAFDCGLASSQNYDHIFLTHQHLDHTQNIPSMCNRHKPGKNNIYAPEESIKYLTKFVRAVAELSDPRNDAQSDEEIFEQQRIHLHGVQPGTVIKLLEEGLEIEVLQAYHDCACVGFGVQSYHKVVLPEYRHLTEMPTEDDRSSLTPSQLKEMRLHHIQEIKDLRSQGIDMYRMECRPEFVFFCDSNIRNLTEHSEWLKYPALVVECTGLAGNKQTRDFDRNHTSLTSLRPLMLRHRDKKWVLIHISATLSMEEIESIERDLLDEGLDVFIFKR